MRPSVLAVSLAAALLMPGAAALADPPWERGHEYEARGCKYEYKAGPHGFQEEYKCDGGGPRYAGGPPPWAPAHGWRRKHAQHHEAGYVQNALKHGLRAQKFAVLPDEDAAEFEALEAALIEELAPRGALQSVLAQRVAVAAWRLARADRIEAELLRYQQGRDGDLGLALIRDGNGARAFSHAVALPRCRAGRVHALAARAQSAPGRGSGTCRSRGRSSRARSGAAGGGRTCRCGGAVRPARRAGGGSKRTRAPRESRRTGPTGRSSKPRRCTTRARPEPRPRRALPRPLPTSGGPALGARPIEPEKVRNYNDLVCGNPK